MTPYRIAAEVPPAPVSARLFALDDLDEDAETEDEAAAAGRSPIEEHEPGVDRAPVEEPPVGVTRAALVLLAAAIATTVVVPVLIVAFFLVDRALGNVPHIGASGVPGPAALPPADDPAWLGGGIQKP